MKSDCICGGVAEERSAEQVISNIALRERPLMTPLSSGIAGEDDLDKPGIGVIDITER